MLITEKVAYLKGLMEGLGMDEKSKETKIIKAMADILEDMALTLADIEDETAELYEVVDALDEDLGLLEEDLFGEENHHHDGCHCGDTLYELVCPSCGEEINIDESLLAAGKMECPSCGENLEFSFEEDDVPDDAE